MVTVAQLVRAPRCGRGGRGFDSRQSPFLLPFSARASFQENSFNHAHYDGYVSDSQAIVDDSTALRARLLSISRELLDEEGPSALSMRAVARRAGCTHQAPYHYFGNREGIVAALIVDGFTKLEYALNTAINSTQADPLGCIEAAANAYVDFALDNPGIFRTMFRLDMCDPSDHPEVETAGSSARMQLSRLSEIISTNKDEQLELQHLLWFHVHGLATLLLDGSLSIELPSDATKREFAHTANTQAAKRFHAMR